MKLSVLGNQNVLAARYRSAMIDLWWPRFWRASICACVLGTGLLLWPRWALAGPVSNALIEMPVQETSPPPAPKRETAQPTPPPPQRATQPERQVPTQSTTSTGTATGRPTAERQVESTPSTSGRSTQNNPTTSTSPSSARTVTRDVVESLNEQARQYERRGQYQQAEPLYREALTRREKQFGANHLAVAAASDNLGNAYLRTGAYQLAEAQYQRSLAIREQKLKPNHPEIAASLKGLGSVYVRTREYAKAETYLQRALELQEKTLGANHRALAETLNNFGDMYVLQAAYAKAEPFHARALAIREKSLGRQHLDVAESLFSLGLVYKNTGESAKAEPLFQRALAIQEKKLGRNDYQVGVTLNNLAGVYANLSEYAKAEPLYQRSIEILARAATRDPLALMAPLYNLIRMYAQTNDAAKLAPLYERTFALVEQTYSANKLNQAAVFNQAGKEFFELAAYDQAEQFFQRGLAAAEKINGGDNLHAATLLGNLAILYAKRGAKAQAAQYDQRATQLTARRAQNGQPANPPPNNAQPVSTTSVERFPTIECPEQVVAEQEFAVQVALTEDQLTPEVKVQQGETTKDGKLALSLPETPNQEPWKIEVFLSAPGFINLNSNYTSILLPKKGDSTAALFRLRAKVIPGAQQQASLMATLWHNGTHLGKIVRAITIVKALDPPTPVKIALVPVANPPTTVVQTKAANSIAIDEKQLAPDLTLFLTESTNANQTQEVSLIIESPHLQPAMYSFTSPKGLTDWLDTNYNRFARQASRSTDDQSREITHEAAKPAAPRAPEQNSALMKGFGRELYQKFAPPAFKEAFWKLTDKLGDKFRSIQIYSDNPALPWELMRPVRGDGERDFLGAEFVMARWHIARDNSQLERPPQSLVMEKLVVVAPQYAGRQALASQQTELEALAKVRGYSTMRGDLGSLKKLLEDLPQGIVHFAGHGGIKTSGQKIDDFVIRLEDGDVDLLMWRGLTASRSRKHPFFFFNACDVGQTQRVANFVNGWAPAVLEKGASGYIGALWPIGDQGASEFAARFYDTLERELQQGPTTVGEVLRKTRRLFLEKADPTYLAYVFYGDPHLRFTEPVKP